MAGRLVDVDVDLACSSGTYVRAIARDLGAALGVGGHLTALRRTAVGGFTLVEALAAGRAGAAGARRVTIAARRGRRRLFAAPGRHAPTRRGCCRMAGRCRPIGMAGPYAVFGPDGNVIAVVVERDAAARPEVVFAGAG